jgi:hypothetical protein
MQSGGVDQFTGSGLACDIRTQSEEKMLVHKKNNHTLEGLGKKLHSETKMAEFFDSQEIKYDRDWCNRIAFKDCKHIEGNKFSARPDFFLPSESARLGALVIIGNDEFMHRQYPCEFQRVFNIANSLDQTPEHKGVPLVYFRVNPHSYRKNQKYIDPPLDVVHNVMWNTVQSLTKECIKPGVNLVFINYDTTNGNLDLFEKDTSNDYTQLYRHCVLRIVS